MNRAAHLPAWLRIAQLVGLFVVLFSALAIVNHDQMESRRTTHSPTFIKDRTDEPVSVTLEVVLRAIHSKGLVIDCRNASEFASGRIPSAVNFTPSGGEIGQTLLSEATSAPIVIVYGRDSLSADALKLRGMLSKRGIKNVQVYAGGWRQWTQLHQKVENDI